MHTLHPTLVELDPIASWHCWFRLYNWPGNWLAEDVVWKGVLVGLFKRHAALELTLLHIEFKINFYV